MPVAHQDTLPMDLSRQEYWNGQPFPSPEDLPNPRIELGLLHCKQIFYHLSQQGNPQPYTWKEVSFKKENENFEEKNKRRTDKGKKESFCNVKIFKATEMIFIFNKLAI